LLSSDYQWCDGQTTATAVGLTAGTCNVTITDGNNCIEIRVFDVLEPMPLNSQLATLDAACNGQSSGVIDIQMSGGTGAYTFQWSEAGLDPTAVAAGTYDVTISDENACQTTISSIVIDEPNALSVDGMSDPATCGSSNGSISLSVLGGNPPYTYDWTDPGIGNTGAPTGLAPGAYDVMVIDGNGCTISSTWSVDTPSGLAVDQIMGNDATCNGGSDGSIEVNIEGGNPPYSFDWNVNALDGIEDPTGLAAGDYLVTITDGDGCTLTASSTITEPSLIVAMGTSIDATCGASNGSIALNVDGGAGNYTFDWDAAMDVQNPTG